MSDLIKREDAIKALQKEINKGIPPFDDTMGAIRCGVRLARNIIEDLPSADRPQGEWILSDLQSQADNDNGNYSYVCTNCNHTDIHAKTQKVPYCWWCGARMKGADDE